MSLALHVIRASRALMDVAVSETEAAGRAVSRPDLLVFMSVFERPGLTAASLTLLLRRDKTTVSRCLSRLAGHDLVTTEIDPFDGRQKTIRVTTEGRLLGERLLLRMRAESEKAAANLSVEDVEAIETFLERLPIQ